MAPSPLTTLLNDQTGKLRHGGYLWKLNTGRRWQKRYFALVGRELSYHGNSKEAFGSQRRIIPLSSILKVALVTDNSAPANSFIVNTTERQYKLHARSAAEAKNWVRLIQEEIAPASLALLKECIAKTSPTTVPEIYNKKPPGVGDQSPDSSPIASRRARLWLSADNVPYSAEPEIDEPPPTRPPPSPTRNESSSTASPAAQSSRPTSPNSPTGTQSRPTSPSYVLARAPTPGTQLQQASQPTSIPSPVTRSRAATVSNVFKPAPPIQPPMRRPTVGTRGAPRPATTIYDSAINDKGGDWWEESVEHKLSSLSPTPTPVPAIEITPNTPEASIKTSHVSNPTKFKSTAEVMHDCLVASATTKAYASPAKRISQTIDSLMDDLARIPVHQSPRQSAHVSQLLGEVQSMSLPAQSHLMQPSSSLSPPPGPSLAQLYARSQSTLASSTSSAGYRSSTSPDYGYRSTSPRNAISPSDPFWRNILPTGKVVARADAPKPVTIEDLMSSIEEFESLSKSAPNLPAKGALAVSR